MFDNVLVGVDRHQGGRDALALGKQLLACDGQLTLAHVYPGNPRLRRESALDYQQMEHERALELLTKVRDEAGVSAKLRYLESSSPGRGLHQLADATHADLLVVGSSLRGLLGRVLLGDDTCDALNGATCAVAIAPMGYSRRPVAIHEIGVAYNGSGESEYAASVARALAAERGAELSACEVITPPAYAFLGGPVPIDGAIEDLVNEARTQMAALGEIKPHVAYGQANEELTAFSASVDLLIVGSRGFGPFGRLVHGSTSNQLSHTARSPLLVLTGARRGPRRARSSTLAKEPDVDST